MDMAAVVIGGSSGIGLKCCERLLGKGYTVYNASRTECENGQVINIITDVAKDGGVEKIFALVRNPDVVIYSAGFSMACPVEFAEEKDYRYLFEVNYFGAVKTVKLCASLMRESGSGKIILVSSMGGVLPIAFDAFYSSSKAALDMLSYAVNMELNPYNVYVTALRPGGTSTRFTFKRKVYPDDMVGVYSERMNKAVVSLADMEQGGMSADCVADSIMSLINMQKPPAVAAAGLNNKSFTLMRRLLPTRLTQFMNKSVYKQ